jgi:hypothetical protein
MYCSLRTTRPFPYVVLSGRSCDSSKGQEGRASFERPIAADHLQDTVGRGKKKYDNTTNVSSYSSRVRGGEERL